MKKTTVKIDSKEYQMGYSLRAMFMFEQLSGHQFGIKTLQDEILYFFCCFMVADSDFMGNDFSSFVDALDKDPSAINVIRSALNRLTANEATGEENGSKKKD